MFNRALPTPGPVVECSVWPWVGRVYARVVGGVVNQTGHFGRANLGGDVLALETDGVHMLRVTPLKTDDTGSIVALRNITFSCNSSTWGPAPSYCVDSAMAEYLVLSGAHYGHDVQWSAFEDAAL